MITQPASDPTDLDPEEANDVLLDITEAQPAGPTLDGEGPGDEGLGDEAPTSQSAQPSAVDPNDGVADNAEEVPTDSEQVEDSSETAERLRRHASVPPPDDGSASPID